jgi:hypothetical protein
MLLATRRTAKAGALVMVAVMSNVVMLNFCFDVPVKLASTHLLVFALVIAAPDARRLWSVFCPRASTGPRDFTPRYARGWGRFVFRSSSSPYGAVRTVDHQRGVGASRRRAPRRWLLGRQPEW